MGWRLYDCDPPCARLEHEVKGKVNENGKGGIASRWPHDEIPCPCFLSRRMISAAKMTVIGA